MELRCSLGGLHRPAGRPARGAGSAAPPHARPAAARRCPRSGGLPGQPAAGPAGQEGHAGAAAAAGGHGGRGGGHLGASRRGGRGAGACGARAGLLPAGRRWAVQWGLPGWLPVAWLGGVGVGAAQGHMVGGQARGAPAGALQGGAFAQRRAVPALLLRPAAPRPHSALPPHPPAAGFPPGDRPAAGAVHGAGAQALLRPGAAAAPGPAAPAPAAGAGAAASRRRAGSCSRGAKAAGGPPRARGHPGRGGRRLGVPAAGVPAAAGRRAGRGAAGAAGAARRGRR